MTAHTPLLTGHSLLRPNQFCKLVEWSSPGSFLPPTPVSDAFKRVTPLTPSSLLLPWQFKPHLLISLRVTSFCYCCDSTRWQKWLQFLPSQYLCPLHVTLKLFPSRGEVYFPSLYSGLLCDALWPKEWDGTSLGGGLQEVWGVSVGFPGHLLGLCVSKPALAGWAAGDHRRLR